MTNAEVKPIEWHIYNELVEALKGAGIENVSLENRSKKYDNASEFVIVTIVGSLNNLVVGSDDTCLNTTGCFYAFEKSKSDNTPNINAQTSLVQKIKKIFPISKTHIEAVKPTVRFAGVDNTSYQVTQIFFNLRTKFNSNLS